MRRALLAFALLFTGTSGGLAASFIWDGGSTVDSNFFTPENWVGDVAPTPGDSNNIIHLAGTARTTINLDANVQLDQFYVDSGAGAFAIQSTGGSKIIFNGPTFSDPYIVNNSSNPFRFQVDVDYNKADKETRTRDGEDIIVDVGSTLTVNQKLSVRFGTPTRAFIIDGSLAGNGTAMLQSNASPM